VDDKFEDVAQEIISEVKKVTDKPIRFLINTHHHGDHTGGNVVFFKITTILAHHNVRQQLSMAREQALKTLPDRIAQLEKQLAEAEKNASPQAAQMKPQLENARRALDSAQRVKIEETLPALTFDSEVRLYLSGEEIQTFHVKRGHTNSDSIVYFPKQKLVHMGDLFVRGYPLIDVRGGGSSREWIETLDGVLKRLDPATQVIPGHGDIAGVPQLAEFKQYLIDLRAAVKKAIDDGLSKEQSAQSIKLEQYKFPTGNPQGLTANINTVYDEIKAGN
jgi:glyoxylase-like metal-dependent hydrolase (beta-lactamase superfamily II)